MQTKTSTLIKTENIIKIGSEETLVSALSKLGSAHDAAFVFTGTKQEEFLGLINPYFCLIRSSLPANTKVSHCVFHPPKLYVNFPIAKVARLMNDSKVHYLPVFDKLNRFLGIISARRMLAALQSEPIFKIKIKEVLKAKRLGLVTVFEDDTIATAVNLFKQYRISKLVVVNHEKKLRGVLSYYDLISFLMMPREKEQRGERRGGKVNLNFQKVKNFAKTLVLTLSPENMLYEALQMIIEKKIGSVVIVDNLRHPIGIITSRDFLSLLARSHDDKKIDVSTKNLSQSNHKAVGNFFNYLRQNIKKLPDTVKARLFVQEEKGGNLFKVVLSLFPKKGRPVVIKREGKDLNKVLGEIKKK